MTKTEACWDRTEGCCMKDAFERKMRRPKRAWGDAPGLIRMSRLGDGQIAACRLCPPSSTGAPRNFAWPKGDLAEAVTVLGGHFRDEHPLRFGIEAVPDGDTCQAHGTVYPCRHCRNNGDSEWGS